jgi:hypothetical protein
MQAQTNKGGLIMNIATLIATVYIVFSILLVYIAARPSNRKRVLNFTLCVIDRSATHLDEVFDVEQLPGGARRVLPWGIATFALLLGVFLIAAR